MLIPGHHPPRFKGSDAVSFSRPGRCLWEAHRPRDPVKKSLGLVLQGCEVAEYIILRPPAPDAEMAIACILTECWIAVLRLFGFVRVKILPLVF